MRLRTIFFLATVSIASIAMAAPATPTDAPAVPKDVPAAPAKTKPAPKSADKAKAAKAPAPKTTTAKPVPAKTTAPAAAAPKKEPTKVYQGSYSTTHEPIRDSQGNVIPTDPNAYDVSSALTAPKK